MGGKLKWALVAVVAVAVVILLLLGTRINRRSEPIPPAKFDDYATQLKQGRYVNTKYKIIFTYPLSWSMNTKTSVFENGDLIAVEFIGPTQKENTEFYDGARLVVMIPQKSDLNLSDWVSKKHRGLPEENPPELNDVLLNGRSFKKVYTCGLGCFTYYYTKIDGQVYGLMVSASGPQKAELEVTIEEMLKKLELGSS